MAAPVFNLKPLPLIDPDPQVIRYVLHWKLVAEKQAAAIESTPKPVEKGKRNDAKKSQ